MKKALITGITGQDGPYLARLLLEKNYQVYGLNHRRANQIFTNLNYLNIYDQINIIDGDLTDESSLGQIIKENKFDELYNMAAHSWIDHSWKFTKSMTEVNAIGVINILNSVKNFSPNTRIFQASSSEIFDSSTTNSINENSVIKPRNPYATSKLYAHWSVINYRDQYNMHCSNGIFFNHDSPLRGPEFLSRKITQGVARIKLGQAQSISLGNLDIHRDWGFAGDYMEAAWLMLQQETPDDYVIASGVTHSIEDILQVAFAYIAIDNWRDYIIQDPKFMRTKEAHKRCGDYTKARTKLNWSPKTDFVSMINNMVQEDIDRL
jgi:GDPmannose 4,6-dehydratase